MRCTQESSMDKNVVEGTQTTTSLHNIAEKRKDDIFRHESVSLANAFFPDI